MHSTAAITEATNAVDSVVAQAQAKDLEEHIYSQATSKVALLSLYHYEWLLTGLAV